MVHARRAIRTQEILDTARALVAQEGLEGLTVHRLAKVMGYAPAALYRYFPSKEALVVELQCQSLTAYAERFSERFEQVEARTELSPKPRALLALIEAASLYSELSTERPDAFRLICFAVGDPRVLVADDAAEKVLEAAMVLLQAVSLRFSRAEKAGALNDAASAMDRAVLFWTSVHGVLQLKKLSRVQPQALDPGRLGAEVVSALLRGWGAPPRSLSRALEIQAEGRA